MLRFRDRRPIQWQDRRIPALFSTAIFGRRHFVLCNILQMTTINQSKRDAFRPFWTGYGMGKIPDQREPKQGRVCALEKAMRNYVDRHSGQVVAPEIGREFDLLAEAFEFYNLYSWDIGFGNRYGQSRTNARKSKIVQDIVCGCAGRLKKENKKSVACNCQALIRLHRTTDKGWYIHDFRLEHNHHLSSSRGEKLHWPSHRNIDTHTKDIVKHLRKCPTNEGSNNRGRNTIAGSVACLVTLGHNAIVDGNHGLDDY